MGFGKIITWGSVGLLAMGASSFMDGRSEEAAVAKYGLSTEQAGFVKECKRAMKSGSVKFKEGSSHNAGCACIASKISPNMTESQMKFASASLRAMTSSGADPSTKERMKMFKNIEKKQKALNISEEQSNYVLKNLIGSMQACGKDA